MRKQREQRGSALIEVVWLSLLLLIPLVYVVVSVFQLQRGAFAVTEAARAAGQAYAGAPDEASGRARAQAAARLALADQKLGDEGLLVRITCRPDPGNCLAPGATIEVRIDYAVKLPFMPAVLGSDTPQIQVDATHAHPYGTFREDR